ncbi:MAG3090 family protein [Mycoplasma sp. Mirounga ES2805-ORL]|uniref:MAG3090 family protein n=1 Tax=Mycoplasma sp. Mirounga ES2805-ORL TaxID=754514 RepID=UPI00197C51F9|nr:hypothetical protein [Mycoplasma sp. Mirounga ES2805-ORL]QSF13807.1 hypothetical protein JXZ90_00690 [Mycoplasma sp. Mirounga ES2805-ORL]
MKRLNLLYKPEKENEFPWLLIHPKVKEGLARFKTRADAINWFLQFNYEVYIWFQTSKKIFGGQLAVLRPDDETESKDGSKDGKLLFIPKITGFDGGDIYEKICEEFNIHQQYLTRNLSQSDLDKKVKAIEFQLISDVNTYFPPDLETTRRKQTEYIDLNSIKASLELRISELEKEKSVAKEQIDKLKEKLQEKELNFMDINKNIDSFYEGNDQPFEPQDPNFMTGEQQQNINSGEFVPEQNEDEMSQANMYDPYQSTQQYLDPNQQIAIYDQFNGYPNGEIMGYDQYGYPTGMYNNAGMDPVKKEKIVSTINWILIGASIIAFLLILFIALFNGILTYFNVI